MKITIDTDSRTLSIQGGDAPREFPLYSTEAFEVLSREWLRVGWNQKYTYTFSWLGRPVIQLPEDLIRVQEVIYRIRPDVIVETGVAHGGSLVFYAGLCKILGKGRVIGIDIDVRAHNRAAIERHELASYISLVDGDSTSPETVAAVRSMIRPEEHVLVLLDSCHTKDHVRRELEAYSELVTPGSYIVATDGIMEILADVPRGKAEWAADNPAKAAEEFAASHPEFAIEQPSWTFNESGLSSNVTHWPGAWLRRLCVRLSMMDR